MRILKFIVLSAALTAGGTIAFHFASDESRNSTGTIPSFFAGSAYAASPGDQEAPDYDAYADYVIPPLPPEKTLERFQLEEGFRIELVAHEPMVIDPVAMDIDHDGRLWVVEMPSYMPVHDMDDWDTAMREQVPQGRVVVLEDTTGDGIMDTSRVFRDELILPRAIKVLDDGVLVAEPPHVWFIQDTNGDGRGDTREIVYTGYGNPNSDNVEHMPNGLMWGMDNWIHSSHEGIDSFRRLGDEWPTRPFRRLGQWGMAQDDFGRLYSAHNTQPIQTHLVPYGYSERHPNFSVTGGKNTNIAPRSPMWPAHVTGVNRGYRDTEVREDGTLLTATATCTPVVYRGEQFGDEYRGNIFVPEPAGNLIKRYLIDSDPAEIEASARFAYEEKEFLTSTDERFRPVNMYNAPDGSLYVVDMYRGLFQHARYLTDHLRDYVVEHDLHRPEGRGTFGRIYRIVRDDNEIDYSTPALSEMEPDELVGILRHENGVLRDLAQQLLVQRSPQEAIPALENLADDADAAPYTRLHALWSLEGFDREIYALERLSETALRALEDDHPRVRAGAVRILEPALAQNEAVVLARLGEMADNESAPFVQLQLVASLGESVDPAALHAMAGILDRNVDSRYFREMALTGVYQREALMIEILQENPAWSDAPDGNRESILSSLADVAEEMPETADADELTEAQQVLFEQGRRNYLTCSACHNREGEGMEGIAPPLAGSDWAQGDPEALIRITLQGFEGEDENITAVMPPHGYLSDEEIAAVLTFIRRSWGNGAAPIESEDIARVREETADRRALWTAEELRELTQ